MLHLRWSTMNSLCEANSCPAKAKIVNKYPDLTIDWKKLYSLAFETILHTKLREFQHRILNLIIFTSSKWRTPHYVPFAMQRKNPQFLVQCNFW